MRTFRIPAALLVAASLALLGCGNLATGTDVEAVDVAPQFSAATPDPGVERRTQNITLFAACTGEFVDLVVLLQGVVRRVRHVDANSVLLVNFTQHGSGVGQTTGDNYQLTQWTHLFFVPLGCCDVARTFTDTQRTTLIHAGRGDNITQLYLTERFVVNANNDFIVDIISSTSQCL